MSSSLFNIIVSGVGGQGTVLAGKLLAHCAFEAGAFVRTAETIGMAQRGGSVLGHVRVCLSDGIPSCSSKPLSSPLVSKGEAQLLIGFEPAETLKAYSYCSQGAIVVSATQALPPPTASLQRIEYDGRAQLAALREESLAGHIASLLLVDNNEVVAALATDKALNVVLLGAALGALEASGSALSSVLSLEGMQRTITALVRERYRQLNLQALEMGQQLACR